MIDVAGAGGLDAGGFLASLEGSSFPLLWIDRLLDHVGERGHLMLYDDLAAAAVAMPELLSIGEETYRVVGSGGGAFEIEADPAGTIRLARLPDHGAALEVLRELWARGPIDRHAHEHSETIPAETMLRSFHGHLGPYVVIGYRMGKLALRELALEGHFGISASVHSPLTPPRSCLIDGVQIGSGCTLGKRNIEIVEGPEPAWAVFASDTGDTVGIRVRPEIPVMVRSLVESRGVEATGFAFFEISLDSLFAVEHKAR
jgi:hypothetical protein